MKGSVPPFKSSAKTHSVCQFSLNIQGKDSSIGITSTLLNDTILSADVESYPRIYDLASVTVFSAT